MGERKTADVRLFQEITAQQAEEVFARLHECNRRIERKGRRLAASFGKARTAHATA